MLSSRQLYFLANDPKIHHVASCHLIFPTPTPALLRTLVPTPTYPYIRLLVPSLRYSELGCERMSSISNLDLALEEKLDEADPLRHLRNDEQHDTEAILPAQAPSVHDQTIQLTFTSTATGVSDPLAVKLAIDASPGCGGVAWPAGEVCSPSCASFTQL